MPTIFRPANVLFAVTALLFMALLHTRPASCAVPVQIRGTVDVMTSSDNLPGQPGDFETFYVSGDKPMPVGATSTLLMNKGQIGAVWCHYIMPDGITRSNLQVDVYQYTPGGPLLLLLICPHCTARGHVGKDEDHGINVRQEVKAMEFLPPPQPTPVFPGWTTAAMMREFPDGLGGLLSTDPFGCTWDVLPHQRHLVGNVCDFHVVIERNVIRRVDRHHNRRSLGLRSLR